MGSLVVVLVVGRHVSHLLQRVLILDADAEKGLLYLAQVIDLPGQKTPHVADDKNLGLDERRLTAFVGRVLCWWCSWSASCAMRIAVDCPGPVQWEIGRAHV